MPFDKDGFDENGLNKFGIDKNGVFTVDLRTQEDADWIRLKREGKWPKLPKGVEPVNVAMDFTDNKKT